MAKVCEKPRLSEALFQELLILQVMPLRFTSAWLGSCQMAKVQHPVVSIPEKAHRSRFPLHHLVQETCPKPRFASKREEGRLAREQRKRASTVTYT